MTDTVEKTIAKLRTHCGESSLFFFNQYRNTCQSLRRRTPLPAPAPPPKKEEKRACVQRRRLRETFFTCGETCCAIRRVLCMLCLISRRKFRWCNSAKHLQRALPGVYPMTLRCMYHKGRWVDKTTTHHGWTRSLCFYLIVLSLDVPHVTTVRDAVVRDHLAHVHRLIQKRSSLE